MLIQVCVAASGVWSPWADETYIRWKGWLGTRRGIDFRFVFVCERFRVCLILFLVFKISEIVFLRLVSNRPLNSWISWMTAFYGLFFMQLSGILKELGYKEKMVYKFWEIELHRQTFMNVPAFEISSPKFNKLVNCWVVLNSEYFADI